jgi:hypothetical protein
MLGAQNVQRRRGEHEPVTISQRQPQPARRQDTVMGALDPSSIASLDLTAVRGDPLRRGLPSSKVLSEYQELVMPKLHLCIFLHGLVAKRLYTGHWPHFDLHSGPASPIFTIE